MGQQGEEKASDSPPLPQVAVKNYAPGNQKVRNTKLVRPILIGTLVLSYRAITCTAEQFSHVQLRIVLARRWLVSRRSGNVCWRMD